jgi:LSD1 subclass zinc finger protein
VSKSRQKKYQKIREKIDSALKRAEEKRDKEEYGRLMEEQTEAGIKFYPRLYSPRIKEENYRRKFLYFIRKTSVVYIFDKDLRNLKEEETAWVNNIQWFTQDGRYIAESVSFQKLYLVFRELTMASHAKFDSMGLFALFPDRITRTLWDRIRISGFLQLWLPYLESEDVDYVLADSGLHGEYHELHARESAVRHCGSCGFKLSVAKGAVRVLCEECGHIINVKTPEFSCPSCSGPVSFPVGKMRIQCPSCKTLIHASGEQHHEAVE